MTSPNEPEQSFDLASSSQIEQGRLPGGEARRDSIDDTVVLEQHGSRSRSQARELLRNEFPADG